MVCKEVVCVWADGRAQDKVHAVRAYCKTDEGDKDTGKVRKLRAVKPECRKAYPADKYHEMREAEAEHSRQKKRISVERRFGKEQCHCRPERCDKKRKSEYRAFFGDEPDRYQKHIDVAELYRQFVEPIEFFNAAYGKKFRVAREREFVSEKADDIYAAYNDKHQLACFFAPVAENETEKKHGCGCEYEKPDVGGVKRFYYHDVLFSSLREEAEVRQ